MILQQLKFAVVLMVAMVMVAGIATSADKDKEQPKYEPQLTKGSPLVTGLADTRLSVGMKVSGKGIPDEAVITAIDPTNKTVTLSKKATESGSPVLTFNYAGTQEAHMKAGSPCISGMKTTGFFTGMLVAGSGIPAGTTISSIGSQSVTLSSPVNVSSGTTLTFQGSIQVGTAGKRDDKGNEEPEKGPKLITGSPRVTLPSTAPLFLGMPVSGKGIPKGTTIASIIGNDIILSANATQTGPSMLTITSSLTLGADTTTGEVTVNGIGDTSKILPGWVVTGTGIPAGTFVTSIDPRSVTLSNKATSGSGIPVSFYATFNLPAKPMNQPKQGEPTKDKP